MYITVRCTTSLYRQQFKKNDQNFTGPKLYGRRDDNAIGQLVNATLRTEQTKTPIIPNQTVSTT